MDFSALAWHPFADKFPLLDGAEWDEFKESVRSTLGIDDNPILYRVVDGKPQGLDGRNRLRACQALGIEPTYKKVRVPDDQVVDFILRQNVHRRHLSNERRQAVVKALREEGQSLRTIAETIGVGEATVRRDLAAGQAEPGENGQVRQNGAPASTNQAENANSRVKGKDGKSYASKGKKPSLCDRCRRVGPTKDCPKCAELRAKKPRKPKAGAVKFDDRKVVDLIGKLARLFNDRANKLDLQKSNAYADVRKCMEHLLSAWDRWQLEKERAA